jgi:hypothetical protein
MNRVIERWAKTYTFTRQGAGSYVNSRWVDGAAAAPVSFRASVQEITGFALAQLPEGERNKRPIWIYTDTQLQIVNTDTQTKGDIVNYLGFLYEVQVLEDWSQRVRYPFFQYRAIRLEGGARSDS